MTPTKCQTDQNDRCEAGIGPNCMEMYDNCVYDLNIDSGDVKVDCPLWPRHVKERINSTSESQMNHDHDMLPII